MNPTIWEVASQQGSTGKHSWAKGLLKSDFSKFGITSTLVNDPTGSVVIEYEFYIKRSYLGAVDLYYKQVSGTGVQDRLSSIPVRLAPAKVNFKVSNPVIFTGFNEVNKLKRDPSDSDIKSGGYRIIINDKNGNSSSRYHEFKYYRSYLEVNISVPLLPKTDINNTSTAIALYRELLEKKLSSIYRDLQLEFTLDKDKGDLFKSISSGLNSEARKNYLSDKGLIKYDLGEFNF